MLFPDKCYTNDIYYVFYSLIYQNLYTEVCADTSLTNRCTTADCGESPVKKQNKQSRATTDYE